MTHLNPTTRRPERGFSLIELLVVIAIIAIISGLILGGVTHLKAGAKDSQAQALLTNLMGNAGMYEVKTTHAIGHVNDSLINWNNPPTTSRLMNAPGRITDTGAMSADYINELNDGNPSYSSGNDNDFYMERSNLYIERFLWAANQMPQIRNNLPALGESFADTDKDGFMEVIDPWGNPVAYGNEVSHNDNVTDDDFLPAYSKAFFASAGKDQKWGLMKKRTTESDASWESYKETDEYKHALDNVYSFDLDRSAAARGD